MEEIILDGERMARARLAELPMGEFYAEDFLDEGFTSKDPLRVSVRVKITKDEFLADFTGNPASAPVSVNTTYPATLAAVGTIFLAITNPRAQFNQGLMGTDKGSVSREHDIQCKKTSTSLGLLGDHDLCGGLGLEGTCPSHSGQDVRRPFSIDLLGDNSWDRPSKQ